ncbi:MAG: hypothetical protein JF599_04590 [Verrucomicrobia bacterium]|nr:hypothetical protein [Verrucomicrobiota bacterium]
MSTPSTLFFFAGLLLAGSASLEAASLDELVKDSPFLPKGADAIVAPTENAVVEFRGMITTKEGVLFGLYDRTKQTGSWVRQGDKSTDFVVNAYDAGNDTLSFEYQGQKFNLTLASSRINTAAPSAPPSVPSPTGGTNVVATPGRGDDQRKLESIAAEVRRRRALRQGAGAGAAATPAPANGAKP